MSQVENLGLYQGGKSWQPFSEGKIGHKNFRQVRIYYFRNKCIVANLAIYLV